MIKVNSRRVKIAIGNCFDVDIRYFAESPINVGDLCFVSDKESSCVNNNPFSGLKPIGISIYEIIPMDARTAYHNPSLLPCGSKITMIKRGEVGCMLPKKWKLPAGQKLYLDPSTLELSWRKTAIRYGKVIHQDEIGLTMIKVKL